MFMKNLQINLTKKKQIIKTLAIYPKK